MRTPTPPPAAGAARAIEETWAQSPEQTAPVVQRPDGFYWVGPVDHCEFGPFETAELARADRDRFDEQSPQPGETLGEAEAELGVADWIDPQTGEPAEGQSPPHLDGD